MKLKTLFSPRMFLIYFLLLLAISHISSLPASDSTTAENTALTTSTSTDSSTTTETSTSTTTETSTSTTTETSTSTTTETSTSSIQPTSTTVVSTTSSTESTSSVTPTTSSDSSSIPSSTFIPSSTTDSLSSSTSIPPSTTSDAPTFTTTLDSTSTPTPTPTPSSESSSPPATSISPQTDSSGRNLSGGAIAGIAIGAAGGVLLIGLLILFFIHRSQKQKNLKLSSHFLDNAVYASPLKPNEPSYLTPNRPPRRAEMSSPISPPASFASSTQHSAFPATAPDMNQNNEISIYDSPSYYVPSVGTNYENVANVTERIRFS